MAEPYVFKHIDINDLPESKMPPYVGTRAECLRDALLDVIHAGLGAGLSNDDVDEAVAEVVDHVTLLNRERIRLLRKAEEGAERSASS